MSEAKEVMYSAVTNKLETPTEYIIKLRREGLLDDSVNGDIHIFDLKKSDSGYWKVITLKRASHCWRDKSKGFQAKPCT